MKKIRIGEQEYQMEFTFEAADHDGLVQSMFRVMSGSYIVPGAGEPGQVNAAAAMMEGIGEMISDLPQICRTAFYAGLLEHHRVTENQAKQLMRQYMTENSLGFLELYEELQGCMEEDGFFGLSGLTGMLTRMNAAADQAGKTKRTASRKSRTSTS